ncbi:uncharacterized protein HHUB_4237 (plasmid) [Halobacterium hubeiense]|uniref:Uncharacterized protein n=1 Tax=Halobacterium hubeiense TaxID=1407499 RepID=A0A0U5H9V6_9EURY|nr:hypothetical protein [Halobacterium hubeiense]CQH63953.1 uncharacterized protein HHUB_4237 [Halobacterium hubeiense]
MSENVITLSGPYKGIETSIEACASEFRETSPQLHEACSDHTESVVSKISSDDTVVPGSELADDAELTAFQQFIEKQHTEYWFADLNGRGSDLDLEWSSFKTAIRLHAEHTYLNAFNAYMTASETFSRIEQSRQETKSLLEDTKSRLQQGRLEPESEEQESIQSLFADLKELVSETTEDLEAAKTAVVRAHAYYTIADCYRDEYDLDPAQFSYVSLGDDADWFLEDLRHRRSRSETRVRWIRKDYSKLANTLQDE